ncbi:lysophosphatidic acid receptor 6 [Rhinichthys klamathensis goyatoka]|uniref:lysophosphatidic acid receptor 6 n=1 Tax=Rhinichthys klamathensis goyatoka TaxID=3034132 RepID=UPI0024B522FB|nr:lysophosphatidic acid receptor 6 [Rhinichthys klamathensis goyatoka]
MMTDNKSCTINSDVFKYVLYSSVFSIVFILGLLFNMVAMYIFVCRLKMRNETTTYMMNLVASDTLFVFSLPFRTFYFINRTWPFGKALCQISVALFYTNMYGSILFLTCISVDRFLAIVHPFASKTLRTKRNARIACCVIWVLLLSGGLTAGFVMDTTSHMNNKTYCFENFSNSQWKSMVSKVVVCMETVGFLIPLMINFTCSMRVLQTLRHPECINRGGQLNKAKILRMIAVHLLIFCFCFIPYNVNLVFYTLVRTQVITNCTVESVVRTIYPITFCIAVTNCCFDPVIYYFTSETIQNSIKRKSYAVHKNTLNNTVDTSDNRSSSMNKIISLKAKFIIEESTI